MTLQARLDIRGVRGTLLALIALVPVVLVLWSTQPGVGISIDSVSYVATAESVARGEGLLSFDGLPLTIFPPGYPALLGLLVAAGLSASSAAIAVNVVCIVLIVLGTYVLAREVLGSPSQALIAALFVSLSAATIRTASFAWSEGPFTVLVLAVLLLLLRMRRQPSERPSGRHFGQWWLALVIGVLTALAIAFRYAGLALIPVVLWGVWRSWSPRGPQAVLAACISTGVGVLGFGLLALRNVALGSGPMGERYPGSLTLEGAFSSMVQLFGTYLVPRETTSLTPVLGVLACVLLFSALWVAWLHRARPALLLALFLISYWAVILYGQTAARLDVVTERLAAPALPAMVVLAGYGIRSLARGAIAQIEEAGRLRRGQARRVVVGLGVVGLVGVLGLSLLHGLRFASKAAQEGLGTEITASTSAVFTEASKLPAEAGVASNEPWPLWWARQPSPVMELPPSPEEWPMERVSRSLSRLVAAVRDHEVSFIVMRDSGPRALSVPELQAGGLALTPVADLPDGQIYSVSIAD